MVKRIANRDLPAYVRNAPDHDVAGYGSVSYTKNPYYTGRLNKRLANIFYGLLNRNGRVLPTIYSYGTPIAWKDGDAWITPNVSYSATSAKHKHYLWTLNAVQIPADCGLEEYESYVSGRSVYEPYSKPAVRAA